MAAGVKVFLHRCLPPISLQRALLHNRCLTPLMPEALHMHDCFFTRENAVGLTSGYTFKAGTCSSAGGAKLGCCESMEKKGLW